MAMLTDSDSSGNASLTQRSNNKSAPIINKREELKRQQAGTLSPITEYHDDSRMPEELSPVLSRNSHTNSRSVTFPGVIPARRKKRSAKRKFSHRMDRNLISPPMSTPIRENLIEERKESKLSSQERSSSQQIQLPTPSISRSKTPSNLSIQEIGITQKSRKTFKSEEESKQPINQR